jgi:peptide-methionine (R)-S-oxide reductase
VVPRPANCAEGKAGEWAQHYLTMAGLEIKKSEQEWRAQLSPEEYKCLRQEGTEAPGVGEYHTFFPKEGYFMCRACKNPLYAAGSKFKDCGWDAFDKCFYTADRCHVGVRNDGGGIEVLCSTCGSHLGHVFYGEQNTETNERH